MPGPVACLAWIFNLIQTFHQTRSDSAHIADSKDESRRHISAVYKPTAQAVERQRLVGRSGAEEMSFECDGPGPLLGRHRTAAGRPPRRPPPRSPGRAFPSGESRRPAPGGSSLRHASFVRPDAPRPLRRRHRHRHRQARSAWMASGMPGPRPPPRQPAARTRAAEAPPPGLGARSAHALSFPTWPSPCFQTGAGNAIDPPSPHRPEPWKTACTVDTGGRFHCIACCVWHPPETLCWRTRKNHPKAPQETS